jgi:hypothetical protein
MLGDYSLVYHLLAVDYSDCSRGATPATFLLDRRISLAEEARALKVPAQTTISIRFVSIVFLLPSSTSPTAQTVSQPMFAIAAPFDPDHLSLELLLSSRSISVSMSAALICSRNALCSDCNLWIAECQ